MISMRKINALYTKQLNFIMNNMMIMIMALTGPVFAFIFSQANPDYAENFTGMVMLFNFMSGMLTMAMLIAAEKEMFTLNVLITSTVSVLDFLLSNVLVTVTLTLALNLVSYQILGLSIGMGDFLLLTVLGGAAASRIGAIIGLISKNQISASTMGTLFMFAMMAPMFLRENELATRIFSYLFTERISMKLFDLMDGYGISVAEIAILLANIALFTLIFIGFYKKRGLET